MPFRADPDGLSRDERRTHRLLFVATVFFLAGCAGTAAPAPAGRAAPRGGAAADTPVRIGDAYTVGGRTYVPADDHGYDEVGIASFYGDRPGGRTASGESYRHDAITAAHPTLPLPSYVEVTALDSGRTILVRVNDRGPFARGRIIDLSGGAAALLGTNGGIMRVRVRRAFPPEPDRAALRAGQAAAPRLPATGQMLAALNAKLDGSFGHSLRPIPRTATATKSPVTDEGTAPEPPIGAEPAEAAISPASAPTPKKRTPKARPTPAKAASATIGLYLQLGAFADRGHAEALARATGGHASSAGRFWRVRLGPFEDRADAADALARARARGYREASLVRDPTTP